MNMSKKLFSNCHERGSAGKERSAGTGAYPTVCEASGHHPPPDPDRGRATNSKMPSKAALLRRRVKARRSAVQALYQWQLSGKDPRDIFNEFEAERDITQVDRDYFRTLLREIPIQVETLEQQLIGVIDRPVNELGPVERAVLWIGIYELMFCPEIPWRVVLNEAIELTKLFGAEQAHKYVNGVLDKVAHAVRSQEIAAA